MTRQRIEDVSILPFTESPEYNIMPFEKFQTGFFFITSRCMMS